MNILKVFKSTKGFTPIIAKTFTNFIKKNTGNQYIKNQIQSNRLVRIIHREFSNQNLPPHIKLEMPNLSPTMTKGNIIKWEKKEGDKVSQGDVLCSVETDKAVVDFEVNEDGYLAKIIKPEGSKDVPLGELVAILVDSASDVKAFAGYSAEGASKPKTTAKATPEAADKPKESAKIQESEKPAKAASQDRQFVSPLAKSTAEKQGIDVNAVQGSGPRGRVVNQDVLDHLSTQTKSVAAPKQVSKEAPKTLPTASYEDIELSNMRKIIAERLLFSKTNIPHFYLQVECNIDKLIEIRAELNKTSPVKISINDIIIKAAALACMKIPESNSSWQDTFIRKYNNVDMSVAVQTDYGLITPIVFNANLKGLSQISKDMKELAEKAKQQKLKPQEFQGGTFTLSNLGMMGITNFSAIINPPQACILAVGRGEKKVVFDENAKNPDQPYKVINQMSATLSCDHRVVDGAVGAKWVQEFRNLIENPHLMLL